MASLIDKTTQTVKRISSDLRPGLLDDLGLIAAIEWEAQELEKRTGIQCKIKIHSEELKLKEDMTTAVFRIFQETLTNITRHAKATLVHISLKIREKHLELIIRDNGNGITDKQIKHPKSFGIMGMKERAEYLRGKITYKGIPNKGTTVHLSIPLLKP
jgi:signal transduction histidine kinase